MKQKPGQSDLAWNDADGTVHCGLCDWVRCYTTLEEVEFRMVEHLRSQHGHGVVVLKDTCTGVVIGVIGREEGGDGE